ncbi:MAG: calcium-binding protein [Alphaproteobacteria bacterium]|nr:calcium-binding protein [Alphaproteobacteria bacterium]
MRVDAGTYVNDFARITTNITIEGVGGMVHLQATRPPPDGKAIFTINRANVTLDRLEFSGAVVADRNGAGIRYEGGNLVIRNSYFHDNQDGILAANDPAGTIQIINSEFARNGFGDGQSHGLYVNGLASLHIVGSYFHDTKVGHHIKSRASSTLIENSRIEDGNSTASYSIDLPSGGVGVLRDNFIVQGPNSQNSAIIHFGGEGTLIPGSSLLVTDNVIQNFRSSAIGVLNHTAIPVEFNNNQIYHVTQLASGPIREAGTIVLPAPLSAPALSNLPIMGTEGSDNLIGRSGNDTIMGQGGNDTIAAAGGTDIVTGGDGNDIIFGGGDNDALSGERGNDIIYGEAGSNFLTGGAGSDIFVLDLRQPGFSWSTVSDFSANRNSDPDRLDIYGWRIGVSAAAFLDGTVNGVSAATIVLDLDRNGAEDARITLNDMAVAAVRAAFEQAIANNSVGNLFYFGL